MDRVGSFVGKKSTFLHTRALMFQAASSRFLLNPLKRFFLFFSLASPSLIPVYHKSSCKTPKKGYVKTCLLEKQNMRLSLAHIICEQLKVAKKIS